MAAANERQSVPLLQPRATPPVSKIVTTIRAVLDMFGGDAYIEMSDWIREHDLDVPVVARFCTHKESEHRGELFVYCGGGTALVSFSPQPTSGSARWRPLYLVFDDSDHRAWHVRHGDQQRLPYDQRPDLGPCPRIKLRLVQSA